MEFAIKTVETFRLCAMLYVLYISILNCIIWRGSIGNIAVDFASNVICQCKLKYDSFIMGCIKFLEWIALRKSFILVTTVEILDTFKCTQRVNNWILPIITDKYREEYINSDLFHIQNAMRVVSN